MVGPLELAADSREGDVQVELALEELLAVFELEVVVLLEEGKDFLFGRGLTMINFSVPVLFTSLSFLLFSFFFK